MNRRRFLKISAASLLAGTALGFAGSMVFRSAAGHVAKILMDGFGPLGLDPEAAHAFSESFVQERLSSGFLTAARFHPAFAGTAWVLDLAGFSLMSSKACDLEAMIYTDFIRASNAAFREDGEAIEVYGLQTYRDLTCANPVADSS
jgi:hypothetical protein